MARESGLGRAASTRPSRGKSGGSGNTGSVYIHRLSVAAVPAEQVRAACIVNRGDRAGRGRVRAERAGLLLSASWNSLPCFPSQKQFIH